MSQSAACARCDKENCSAIVIIPAVRDKAKKFDHREQTLELVCPACSRPFSAPLRNITYLDVTDEQLTQGFIERTLC